MKTTRQRLGRWGENLAADYLQQRGYRILDQNARTTYGEIDLIAWQEAGQSVGSILSRASSGLARPTIVFVEVKTRRSGAFGLPEEAITTRKREHLLAAIQAYMQAHPDLEGDWRLDVIAIQCSTSGDAPKLIHFENAISGE